MIDVIPSIFEKDWDEVKKKITLVSPHVDWVQIDVSDGTLVPEKSILTFERFLDISQDNGHDLSFEAHLLVADPTKYIRPLVDAGFKRLIAHLECQEPRLFLDEAKFESVEVGIAIDGATEFEQLEPFLDEVDFVLIMTNEAGEKGREFMPETVEKIRFVREGFPDLPIEVEGGMNSRSARIVEEAGATRLVSTRFIFEDPQNIESAIVNLKQ